MWENSENSRKIKRLKKEDIKQQLIDFLNNNDTIETEEQNEDANKAKKPKDAADIIKQYEEILRTKSKDIKSVAYHQAKVFSHFRANVFKLIEKHSKLMKS